MSATCPFHSTPAQAELSADFDAFTFLADPHPLLARARNTAPVFYDEATEHWVITAYETIREILTDTETFSSVNVLDPMVPFDPAVPEVLEAGGFGGRPFIVNIDGGEHDEHKRIMSKVLHPRAVAQFEPAIRELAVDMIERFPDDEPFDFVDAFALEFPALVVFTFLGMPHEVVRNVKAWADGRMRLFFGNVSAEEQVSEAEGIVEFWQFIEDHIRSQMDDPGDHFVGDLVRLLQSGEEDLTINDIANYCWAFLFAGHETTTNQLSNMVRDMLDQREAWQQVVADPTVVRNAVEESLRMNTSVFNWRRQTTREVELHGVTIPADAKLFVVYGSANRDATMFEDPDRFIVDRPDARRHLGLGFGSHFCVGAGLARLQLKVVLEELTARRPELRLVADAERRFLHNVGFCGSRTLWVHG